MHSNLPAYGPPTTPNTNVVAYKQVLLLAVFVRDNVKALRTDVCNNAVALG